ncbi:hypothetical protein ATPR_0850 [Acetobacter tropicalis NBRC 101654]|uniref:Uncharacterized protein n=1 Tax=Acetobacter tropicalis NBRC 101654 TaxID=749388 RepID=F7VBV1_9PROT|nr:hypothetical protein ATPR_0850 [Acetobacter tropicalis NBRC 101654]
MAPAATGVFLVTPDNKEKVTRLSCIPCPRPAFSFLLPD